MNKRNDNKKFIADIECGSCGKNYELSNIDEVGQRENFSFFHMYCPSCNNTGLLIVDIKGDKETEAATDLTKRKKVSFLY